MESLTIFKSMSVIEFLLIGLNVDFTNLYDFITSTQ